MVFNKLLQNLLRDRNQKEELWSMLNIVKMYHINIHKDILRMMLIVFYDDFADCQRRQFYEICKNSGLYVFLMVRFFFFFIRMLTLLIYNYHSQCFVIFRLTKL